MKTYPTVRILFRFSTFLTILLMAGCHPSASAALYGQKIVAPRETGSRLRPALEDLKSTLLQMSGVKFEVSNEYSGPGIYLVLTDDPAAPTDAVGKLKDKGFEPFIIRSKDDKNLWIIANAPEGLTHGIYYYLNQLGCRWLLWNDRWTVVPQRADITLKTEGLHAPAFKVRSYAGTGGFGGIAAYDPKLDQYNRLAFQARVLDWQRRNGFGEEYHLDGHSGEEFNAAKKEELLAHPEYLAMVDGQRVPWSVTAKLDASNPGAVKLYTDWALDKLRERRKHYPNQPYSIAVSVDPADGGGACNSGPCTKIGNGSPSDQTFYLANHVARAVRAEFPDGYVNLYAYNEHAAVPSFPIEENVIVMIIPYAFNKSGLTAEQFIKAWGEAVPENMMVYDYWSITDWTQDEPTFNYLETPVNKIRYWHDSNIVGFNGESTYGAGAMGLGWYVASRLMWNPDTDVPALLDEWYTLAFGPAKAPMKKMLERWAKGFMLNSAELGLSYRDINEAYVLAKGNDAVTARLDDYARYLGYLSYKLILSNTKDPKEREAIMPDYVEYLFDIYDSSMVHSFRLYQFAVDYGRIKPLFDEFNNSDMNAPGWNRIHPLTHDELATRVTEGAKYFPPPSFEIKSYGSDFVSPIPIAPWQPVAGDDFWGTKMSTKGGMNVHIIAPRGLKTLPLRVATYYAMHIDIIDDKDGSSVFTHDVEATKIYEKTEDVQAPLPHEGSYTIQFRPTSGGGFYFQTARGLPLSFGPFISEMGAPCPRVYFYVPKGLKTLAMYFPQGESSGGAGQVRNSNDVVVPDTRTDNGKLVTWPVAAGQDGQVWSIEGSRSADTLPRFLNAPNAFGFSPDTLLLPSDIIKTDALSDTPKP
jgi:hypothetical protein